MARPASRKRGPARKSARAKAALRSAAAVAGSPPPVLRRTRPEARATRPGVDFLDPLMRHAAMQARGVSLCAFLVTLAAFQRGLRVTFHYQRATAERRFAKARMQGHRGELFSISNGQRSHTFSRTLGDRTDPTANAVAEDKHLTKAALKRAGVRIPEGIVVEHGQSALVEKFLARQPDKRFVVKPYAGSLAEGVQAGLAADAVLPAVRATQSSRVLVEEHVAGCEYRATVVAGRCVAVSRRHAPVVDGDGRSSVAQLVARVNQRNARHPYLPLLDDKDQLNGFLARTGRSLDTVLPEGERVALANTSYGVDHEDVTQTAPEAVKRSCEAAASAIGLINCGIDLIVDGSGHPYMLELNQRSYIGMHSFPSEGAGQGNAVAEAIVDAYFPETVGQPSHPALAYDFAPLRAALASGQFAELSLPVIGPDWRVSRLDLTGIAAGPSAKLFTAAAQAAGVHLMQAPLPDKGVVLSLAYTPVTLDAMIARLPEGFRNRLSALKTDQSAPVGVAR